MGFSLSGLLGGGGGSSSTAATSTDQSQNQRQINFAGGSGSGQEVAAGGDVNLTETGLSGSDVTALLDNVEGFVGSAFQSAQGAADAGGTDQTTSGDFNTAVQLGGTKSTIVIIAVAIVIAYAILHLRHKS